MARGRLGAVLVTGVAVLALVGCDSASQERGAGSPASAATPTPTQTPTPTPTQASAPTPTQAPAAGGAGAGCVPTRGEASQGTGAVAAGTPSTARLGPGGELERTPETVAAGRGGQRLVVSGTVYRDDCRTPLVGASIEVWQTNAEGKYGPAQGTADERCCYLAAALRTDGRGRYRFETVKPGHYKGEARPPPAHIHFEVRHPDATGLLTELLFEGDPALGPNPPGEVVRPTPVPGSDPPTLSARFDIVLRR
jgi:protocatechuate 3,4-dioxygenase beta subunit